MMTAPPYFSGSLLFNSKAFLLYLWFSINEINCSDDAYELLLLVPRKYGVVRWRVFAVQLNFWHSHKWNLHGLVCDVESLKKIAPHCIKTSHIFIQLVPYLSIFQLQIIYDSRALYKSLNCFVFYSRCFYQHFEMGHDVQLCQTNMYLVLLVVLCIATLFSVQKCVQINRNV